jgi:hypothetical protein
VVIGDDEVGVGGVRHSSLLRGFAASPLRFVSRRNG